MNTKSEAYSCFGQIQDTLHDAGLFIGNNADLSSIMIQELNLLGELGRKVRNYYNEFKDDVFARDVSALNRAVLLQLSGWYSLPEETSRSVINCHRYLLEVAEKSGNIETEDKPKLDTPKGNVERFAERLKQLTEYKKAIQDGQIIEPYIWTGTKVDLARWLSPLISQKDYGELKVNNWQEAGNLFEINGKKVSANELRSALSKTQRKENLK